jgi:D-amino-acid dehydrogenase
VRVVVVGAGVVGLATALELVLDDHEVTVIDSGEEEASTAASAARIAVCEATPLAAPGTWREVAQRLGHPDAPAHIRRSFVLADPGFLLALARSSTEGRFRSSLAVLQTLAGQALDGFDEWTDVAGQAGMRTSGVLLVFDRERPFRARLALARLLSAAGSPEILVGSEIQEREPSLTPRARFALSYATDRSVDPDALLLALRQRTQRAGATFVPGRVAALEGTAERVTGVRHANGSVPCEAAVIAAGAWSAPLVAGLGVPLPIRAGRGYWADFAPSPVPLAVPVTLEGPHVAVTPLADRLRVGGTMEFTALGSRPVRARLDSVTRAVAASFVSWPAGVTAARSASGLRPITPDGLPIVGRLGGADSNAFVVAGHGMLGLTLAPATARMVRDLVRGETDRAGVLRACSLRRFGTR